MYSRKLLNEMPQKINAHQTKSIEHNSEIQQAKKMNDFIIRI